MDDALLAPPAALQVIIALRNGSAGPQQGLGWGPSGCPGHPPRSAAALACVEPPPPSPPTCPSVAAAALAALLLWTSTAAVGAQGSAAALH